MFHDIVSPEDAILRFFDCNGCSRKRQVFSFAVCCLLLLPEKYREVLVCLYFEERSVAECAKVLGISEGTVKSRLSRAREKFRVILEREWKGGA